MNFDELEKLRQKAVSYYLYVFIGGLFFIIGLIVLLVTRIEILGIFLAIGGIVTSVLFISKQSKFKHQIKEKLIRKLMIDNCGGDVYYNMNERLPELSEILQLNLIKHPDRIYGEDYYSTCYNGVAFSCSDIRLQEKRVVRDSKGRTTTTYVDYFNGRMLVFKPEICPQNIFIREKGSMMNYMRGLHKIETELTVINERYEILAEDNVNIYKFLTPVVLQGLMSLENMVRGVLSYAFVNGKIYVFVERNSNALDIRLTRKLDQNEINFLINALRLPLEIIDKLKLNSEYFK